jgi:hypothetical protein
MKVEFKASCEIDGKEFRVMKRNKPVTHVVAGYFIFIAYFVSLLKDGKAKIVEVSEKDFEDMPEEFEGQKPDEFVIDILGQFQDELEKEEPSKEGEENDETISDSSSSSDSSVESSEDVKDSEEQSSDEVKENDSEEVNEPSEDEKEFAFLEDKKLRLTNKEKKRHAELKAKLKG